MNEKLHLLSSRDLIWAPICLIILYIIAHSNKRKLESNLLRKYYTRGLNLRFLFTVLYTLTIEYYYNGGDTSTFYRGVWIMQDAVNGDASMLGDIFFKANLEPTDRLGNFFYSQGGFTQYYMYQVSNYMVSKLSLPFSIFFGRSYLAISFCLSFFAFSGCWRIFRLFYSLYPHLHKKIAIATLFLPSILFWSSALMKDSFCMGAFGFFIYACYQFFFLRKKLLVSAIVLFLSAILLYYIKPYIILCAIPAMLIWAFALLGKNIKDRGVRLVATFLFGVLAVMGSLYFMQSIASSEIASQYALQNIVTALESQQGTYDHAENIGSYFTVGEVNNSITGILLLFPVGVIASLFRPFLWEIGSPIMLLTALESLAFLWLTILCFRFVPFKKFRLWMSQEPILIFCLVYSILFAGLVGMTTLNFGTLARYKIPALPLYLLMLFVLLDKSGKAKPNIIINRKLF